MSLKRLSSVGFVGIDTLDDIRNNSCNELFVSGGCIVSDELVLSPDIISHGGGVESPELCDTSIFELINETMMFCRSTGCTADAPGTAQLLGECLEMEDSLQHPQKAERTSQVQTSHPLYTAVTLQSFY